MGEVDYQLALLLQHQFEQELRRSKDCNVDLELARTLQEQFQKEHDIEKPTQNLVYNENKIKNSTKSLTDPSWEVVDPTPDIHVLFMAFNERFFWNKLLAVCVSWSKRMTTCAGICSYQGRGGLCSITLSEPLLKLRPRKDLIETLLHEMIHAYLFVTHNNRDRDGHGPEFHKHMYRINAEAGTKITVYHDFHDEVRLYQQHWWRCDGPCQKWKPYFGMVRRAMNRAPGPNDRWWGEHSRNCGGNFIKVKEPEKQQKKNSKSTKENFNPKEDIRKLLPPINKTNSTENSIKSNTALGNVHTITNMNKNSKIDTVIPSKESNIFGFTNLNGSSNSSKAKPSSSQIKGGIRNNSSTIVINKTQSTSKTDTSVLNKIQNISNNSATNATGNILSDKVSNNNLDYSVVRNHWLNKFSNATGSNSVKRRGSQDTNITQSKLPKLSPHTSFSSATLNDVETQLEIPNMSNSLIFENQETVQVECPICMQKVGLTDLNAHVDECLVTPKEEPKKECIICGKKVLLSEYEKHVLLCSEENFGDDDFENSQSEKTKCSLCGKKVALNSYSEHLGTCLDDFCRSDKANLEIVDLTRDKSVERQCAVCEKMISEDIYDSHAANCLLKMYDDMEAAYTSRKEEKVEMVDCLACGKNILKSELGLHLEDCMSLSRVFADDNEPEEEMLNGCDKKEQNYNCPFCMKLIHEEQMKSHIDICLNTKVSSFDKEKSAVLECFSSSEDF